MLTKERSAPLPSERKTTATLNIRSINVVDILIDAAEFDPDKMVKDKAVQALHEMKTQQIK